MAHLFEVMGLFPDAADAALAELRTRLAAEVAAKTGTRGRRRARPQRGNPGDRDR